METCAVIVGASVYRQKEIFAPLRGAARDAIWFERFLRGKGLPSANIVCLTGKAATKNAILGSISGWTGGAAQGPLRLLIFFSGHGGTLRLTPDVSECVLFCHDTLIRDRLGTSIRVAELFQSIAGVTNADEIYLFLDACHLTIDALAEQIQVLARGSKRARVFCCLLANDGGISVEGFASSMGEFSSVLLASILSVDSNASPSIAALVLEVARLAGRTGVSCPTSILLGDPTRWPFSVEPGGFGIRPPAQEVPRPQMVERALGLLRTRSGARLCISGASGTGKSVVLNQVAAGLGACPVARFTRGDGSLPLNLAVQRVVEAIASIMPGNIQRPVALTLDTALHEFSDGNPHAVIAIDGGEILSDEMWLGIVRAFEEHGVDLLTTRHDRTIPGADAQSIDIEPMTLTELMALPGVALRSLTKDTVVRARATSGGFPLAFLQAIDDNSAVAFPESLRRAEQFLRLSRGFCDELLYCAMTGVTKQDLDRLKILGLLVQTQELVRLHDAAGGNVDSDSIELAPAVGSYWEAELGGNYALTASLKIVELSTDPMIQFAPGTVAAAIKRAEARVTSSALTNAALAASRGGDESALVEAVDILSRRGNGELLASLLDTTDAGRADEGAGLGDPRIALAKARAAWWAGDYAACRRHARRVLAEAASHHQGALLEIAIADFFEGRWPQAQAALELLAVPGSGDLREVGWAQLILGTCLGIRGVDGERGRSLLHSAAELLRASNDLAGAAIAKGNCGEVSWKGGNFAASESELKEGLALARSLEMSINAVESQRNLLQLYLRWVGPSDSRIRPLEDALSSLTIDEIGKMEMMQVSNTLATLYLYRKDLAEAEKWLAVARPLTAGNDEYDIYTLANVGLWLALMDVGGARSKIASALDLCATGENLLALNQIRQDIVFCLALVQPKLTSELLSMVDRQSERIKR